MSDHTDYPGKCDGAWIYAMGLSADGPLRLGVTADLAGYVRRTQAMMPSRLRSYVTHYVPSEEIGKRIVERAIITAHERGVLLMSQYVALPMADCDQILRQSAAMLRLPVMDLEVWRGREEQRLEREAVWG